MRRTEIYKTPQFLLALIGSWLVVSGGLGWYQNTRPQVSDLPGASRPSRLRVVTSSAQASERGVNQLQGAGGLQGQASQGLQQPQTSELVQPNAKTNSFGPGDVQ